MPGPVTEISVFLQDNEKFALGEALSVSPEGRERCSLLNKLARSGTEDSNVSLAASNIDFLESSVIPAAKTHCPFGTDPNRAQLGINLLHGILNKAHG